MTDIIAIANQKGGAAKTGTVLGLASALNAAGRKVLLVDLDPQGNLTGGVGVEVTDETLTTNDVLAEMQEGVITQAITTSPWGVDIVPTDVDLANRDTDGAMDVPYRLRAAFKGADLSEYSCVLVDCPPSLGRLLLNGLFAADRLVLPTPATVSGILGIERILKTTDFVKSQVNEKLKVDRIVVGLRLDRLEQDYREQELRSVYPDLVADTVIPLRSAWDDAYGASQPIHSVKGSKGALSLQLAFDDLAKELNLI